MALDDLKFGEADFWEFVKNSQLILQYINAMHHARVILPPGADVGSAKIIFGKSGWVLDFSNTRFATQDNIAIIGFQAFGIVIPGVTPSFALRVAESTVNDMDESDGLTLTGDETAPTGYWQWAIPASSTYYLVAKITLGGGGASPVTFTSPNLSISASPSTTGSGDSSAGTPPATAYRKIIKVVTTATGITVSNLTQLGAQTCSVLTESAGCTSETLVTIWTP